MPSLGMIYDQEKKGSQVLCETFGAQVATTLSTTVAVPRWTRYCPTLCYAALRAVSLAVPDAFVVSGRRSFRVAHYIKKLYPRCKMIALLDPKGVRRSFDLIIAPYHDQVPVTRKQQQVLATVGGCLGPLPRAQRQYAGPCDVYVMVGGENRTFVYTEAWVHQWITSLIPWQNTVVLGLSRRTPPWVQRVLQHALPLARCVTQQDEHRYYVHESRTILVTQDSVSMISEALMSTTASVGIIKVPSRHNRSKFHAFTQDVVMHQGAYIFQGKIQRTPRPRRASPPLVQTAWKKLWMP